MKRGVSEKGRPKYSLGKDARIGMWKVANVEIGLSEWKRNGEMEFGKYTEKGEMTVHVNQGEKGKVWKIY